MKIATIIFILVAPVSWATYGQSATYDWQPKRQLYTLSAKEEALNEYYLKVHREYNYYWDNEDLIALVTYHNIVRVVNPEAIERNNTIYISIGGASLVNVKARSMNKAGKVVLFDQSNMKEIKDEKTANTYKAFAIEGVETGSEIEYIYTLKFANNKMSCTEFLQFEAPVREETFTLTSPKKMIYDFRIYGDTAQVRKDTLVGRNRYQINLRSVPGLTAEKFSAYEANRKKVEFKLAQNLASGQERLNTWRHAARTHYRSLVKVDNESSKSADEFIKTLGDQPSWNTVKRIKNVEDRIKNTIKITKEADGESYNTIPDVFKYKQASTAGMTRLLSVIFDKLSIPFQIVITCDRDKARFDGTFDSWAFLDFYLIYFPTTKGFMTPNVNELRYPLVEPDYTANQGLFIEPVKIGSLKSALGSIHEIPALPYTANTDDLQIDVRFDDQLENNIITQTRTFVGYQAAFLNAIYKEITTDQQAKFVQETLRGSIPDVKILNWSVKRSEADGLPQFQLVATFSTAAFIETAGPKVLFKAGELIGPQTELYRDEDRKTDIENGINRGYARTITVTLPAGYKSDNVDKLKMNVAYSSDANTPYLFKSDYSINGNQLKIDISEYYNQITAPVSQYEAFRKVVNASADFNKVTLVLTKGQ